MTGDRQRLLDGDLDRALVEVGGARRTLALAGVDGQRQAAVARVLYGFHFAKAHIHGEARVDIDANLDLLRAATATARDHVLGDRCQSVKFRMRRRVR